MITLSKASVAMAVAICIWQEVSSGHSDAANTALAANMLARMVLAAAPQLRCTVSLTHSLTHSLSLSLSLMCLMFHHLRRSCAPECSRI